jgi:hypothetical protein
MPKRASTPDINQNAARVVALSTGQSVPENVRVSDDDKRRRSEAASMLGKLGGAKGGRERAKRLTKEERVIIARKAAESRWHKRESRAYQSPKRPR